MTHEQLNNIKKHIVEKIKQGEVLMRPRWYFVLKAVLAVAGVLLVFVGALYFLSFIVFMLHETGLWFVPAFGFSGLSLLIFSLPWILLFVSGVCFIALEVLVRKYSFAYRTPVLYSVLALLLLVMLGSVFLSRIEFHERLWGSMRERHVPVLDPFYRGYAMPHAKRVHPVVVASTTEHGFFAVDRDGDNVEITISPETRLPFGSNFDEGDEVVIIGNEASGSIEALGIAPMRRGGMPMHTRTQSILFMRTR